MSTYVSKFRASIPEKCSVCLSNVKSTIQLPCKHKFCSKCVDHQITRLEGMLDRNERVSIVCPYCREFFMSSLYDRYVSQPVKDTKIPANKTVKRKPEKAVQCCQLCAEGSRFEIAAFWCKNCAEYMCSSCSKLHLSVKPSKGHIVQTILDKERYGEIGPRIYDGELAKRGPGKLIKQVGTRRTCEPCSLRKKRNPAEYICDTCNELFCGECTLVHKSMKMTKSHDLLSLRTLLLSSEATNGLELPCEIHSNEMVSLFCKRCQISCCAMCALTTHNNCGEKGLAKEKPLKAIGAPDPKPSIQDSKEKPKAKNQSLPTKANPKAIEKSPPKSTIARNKMENRKGRIAIESSNVKDWVISMAILSSGDILILQLYESPLKMIDSIGNIVASLSFQGHPWSVAVYNESLGVVSFSDQKRLQLININKRIIEPGKRLATRHKCISVCFSRHLLVTTCWEGCVHLMNIAGEELGFVDMDNNGQKMFKNPEYIASDKNQNIVYISDYKRNSVTALKVFSHKIDNKPVFVFSDPELKGPKGVSVDRVGAVYVSGMASRNIFRLSPEGAVVQKYNRREDTEYYEDIAVSPTENKLLVSAFEDSCILVIRFHR